VTWIDLWCYTTLFLVTLLYAIALEAHDRRIEPEQASDRTLFKVIIGTFLVLLTVAIMVAAQPALTGWQAVQRMVLCFVVGGTPISIWQLWLGRLRRDRAIDYLRRRRYGDKGPAVAESSSREEG
jgi:hypothetical protein